MEIIATIALGVLVSTAQDLEPGGPLCRANGQWYRQGEIACIQPPCMEPQLALCGMVLNNSAWRKLQDGCPTTMLPGGKVPAMASMSVRGALGEASCRK